MTPGRELHKALTRIHAGTVLAPSNEEGRGGRFTQPLIRIPSPHESSGAPGPAEHRKQSRRVLVIGNSDLARQRLRLVFELAGHVVYDALDVERGVELVKTASPDVGIIDLSSPVVDRRLVAKRFREAPHGRMMVLVAVGPVASATGTNGLSKDGFDFHFAHAADVEPLAHRLSNGAPQAQTAAPRPCRPATGGGSVGGIRSVRGA